MIHIDRPACPHPVALANQDYKHRLNKQALAGASFGKCMYCEGKVQDVAFGHVEHFKPRRHFPELEFVWENLGFACERCNVAKGDQHDNALPFIDPYTDEPSDFLISNGAAVLPRPESYSGDWTVVALQLNRADLIEKRNERLSSVHTAFLAAARYPHAGLKAAALRELERESLPSAEFSFVVKTMLDRLTLQT